ncbi:60S ribosomal protein L18a-3 [Glycine soja]
MKLWSTNKVCVKSKFWYFLRKLKKVKKSNDQVLALIYDFLTLCFFYVCQMVTILPRKVLPQHTNTFSSMLNYIRCMSSSKLFIGGLSYGVDDQSLKDASSGFGYVVDGKGILSPILLLISVAPLDFCLLLEFVYKISFSVWPFHL